MRILIASLCTLEPQVTAHAAEMFDVLSDPAIYEFENSPPRSVAALNERFARLALRQSADGTERWLNWVIRLPSGKLAGYVQATVTPAHIAFIAYELSSQYWRRGIGSSAVWAVLKELASRYEVLTFVAILKTKNFRSMALLTKAGFARSTPEQAISYGADQDEVVLIKAASSLDYTA